MTWVLPGGEIKQGKGRSQRSPLRQIGEPMRLSTKQKTPTEELKNAAITALRTALSEESDAKDKRGLTGVRAVATGAIIYTAGRAAFKGRRFLREQLSSHTDDDQPEDDLRDEEAAEAREDRDEPEAEDHEVVEDVESDEEPEAFEEDEDEARASEEEEPEAFEEDEDEARASEEEEEPEAFDEDEEEPQASEEDEDEPAAFEEEEGADEEDDERGDDTGDDEPEEGDGGPSGEAEESPEAEEASDDGDADQPDDDSRAETPTPLPQRKPMRRAARKKGAQPSLKLPQQSRT